MLPHLRVLSRGVDGAARDRDDAPPQPALAGTRGEFARKLRAQDARGGDWRPLDHHPRLPSDPGRLLEQLGPTGDPAAPGRHRVSRQRRRPPRPREGSSSPTDHRARRYGTRTGMVSHRGVRSRRRLLGYPPTAVPKATRVQRLPISDRIFWARTGLPRVTRGAQGEKDGQIFDKINMIYRIPEMVRRFPKAPCALPGKRLGFSTDRSIFNPGNPVNPVKNSFLDPMHIGLRLQNQHIGRLRSLYERMSSPLKIGTKRILDSQAFDQKIGVNEDQIAHGEPRVRDKGRRHPGGERACGGKTVSGPVRIHALPATVP